MELNIGLFDITANQIFYDLGFNEKFSELERTLVLAEGKTFEQGYIGLFNSAPDKIDITKNGYIHLATSILSLHAGKDKIEAEFEKIYAYLPKNMDQEVKKDFAQNIMTMCVLYELNEHIIDRKTKELKLVDTAINVSRMFDHVDWNIGEHMMVYLGMKKQDNQEYNFNHENELKKRVAHHLFEVTGITDKGYNFLKAIRMYEQYIR